MLAPHLSSAGSHDVDLCLARPTRDEHSCKQNWRRLGQVHFNTTVGNRCALRPLRALRRWNVLGQNINQIVSLASLPDLLRNLLRNPVAPDLALHQTLPDLLRNLSPEPCWTWLEPFSGSPEPCWTWPLSAPKPPRPSPEPSEPCPEPRWTWPYPAPVHTGAILGWRPH